MRVLEILLPKGTSDRSISPQMVNKIDELQKRMDQYVDKICDPSTSAQGREFLKSKLRDDYYDLKDTIQHINVMAEDDSLENVKYEVYDKRTGTKVAGPYATRTRARSAVDKLDNKYGGYRYGYRPINTLNEAVHKLPLSNDDFDLVKKIMEKPIPAVISSIYIHEIINDDELNDQIKSFEDAEPNRDVRPLIAEWLERVMPDQMYRFRNEHRDANQEMGLLSPIHGYDPKMYKGTNDPITGNAYGKY